MEVTVWRGYILVRGLRIFWFWLFLTWNIYAFPWGVLEAMGPWLRRCVLSLLLKPGLYFWVVQSFLWSTGSGQNESEKTPYLLLDGLIPALIRLITKILHNTIYSGIIRASIRPLNWKGLIKWTRPTGSGKVVVKRKAHLQINIVCFSPLSPCRSHLPRKCTFSIYISRWSHCYCIAPLLFDRDRWEFGKSFGRYCGHGEQDSLYSIAILLLTEKLSDGSHISLNFPLHCRILAENPCGSLSGHPTS